MSWIRFLSLIFLVIITSASIDKEKLVHLLPQLDQIIEKGKQNIWKEIQPEEPLWNFPPWLGTFFLSEYYFELKAIHLNENLDFKSKFNETYFTAKLLNDQLADGSWKQLIDQNRKQGSLDATIFNYWYLKDVGVDQKSNPMKKARKFILDHGGIEKAQVMTRYKLAVFGQYEWQLLYYVPLFLFQKKTFQFLSFTYIKDYVAQWVYPHLTGLAYLRYHKTIFPVSKVCISQLMVSRAHPPCQSQKNEQILRQFNKLSGQNLLVRDEKVDNLMHEMILLQGKRGAFGAYTISTLLNLLSFKDYSLRYDDKQNEYITFYKVNLEKSLRFVEDMYFNSRVPYQGSLDDGRYWDTILAVYALLEAGQDPKKVHPTVEYLVKTAVQQNGGIPYGHEFQYAPDIDDTGMLLLLYGKLRNHFKNTSLELFYQKQINRTYNWLISNQNADGGFPAFDKDKNDGQHKFIALIFWITNIDKSAQIFDPSCADIVGHLLEGFGQAKIYQTDVITKMISYLLDSRKDGMWSARWGINYVYAVGAVFPGLAKVGYNMSEQWILNITKRLIQTQQLDGGFGQDHEGYNLGKYLQGATTASMTAWGLLAYLEVADYIQIDQNIQKAARYLITNFRSNNEQFFDRSVVGTGHRGVLNLQYPVYAYSFPLVALSRLRSYIKNEKKPYYNEQVIGEWKKLIGNKSHEL